jgi:hypothetical protein
MGELLLAGILSVLLGVLKRDGFSECLAAVRSHCRHQRTAIRTVRNFRGDNLYALPLGTGDERGVVLYRLAAFVCFPFRDGDVFRVFVNRKEGLRPSLAYKPVRRLANPLCGCLILQMVLG